MQTRFKDKVILLTGGTGSFGRAFTCRLVRDHDFRALRVLSRDELKQSEMRSEIQDPRLRFLLGDVRDRERVYRAMQGVDVVVHAAALKQIPACEYNPFEAVKTNILGAQNLIDAAIDCGVERVVALSTDKAVNPVNLYGATKLCAEKIVIQGNAYTGGRNTRLSCVRYGNVVGSRGSVIPLFREQRPSGVLTITDPRMTRFWITLDEAVQLVLDAVDLLHGGEIFIPVIPSMKVTDLARAMAPDCEIKEIGIRPGEKLHEVMVTEDEARHALRFDKFFVIEPEHPWWKREKWEGGKTLPDGFRYSSDNNTQWLTVEELRRMIGEG
ncbi:MAG: UDP-N-acetylglucosamine 4,6-dehydratase (inverting) [Deltaproteobacteria bacterium]|nr:UDP-N-acetylglucosamine 4,6-dehydratase (inverting) [Deltaproteobacteria bacterium]